MSYDEIEDGMGFSGLVPTKAERWLERELKSLHLSLKTAESQKDAVHKAIECGGFVLGDCKLCGQPVVFLNDGLPPICCDCAKEMNE